MISFQVVQSTTDVCLCLRR